MRMTTLRVVIGLGAALALTRVLEGILYGVSARDALTSRVASRTTRRRRRSPCGSARRARCLALCGFI
jgi:hypothetical protein